VTASIQTLRAGAEAATYYTADASIEGAAAARDEYYSLDGAGTWWTTSGTLVQHDAHIDKKSFSALCAGLDPTTHRPLVRGAGPGHRAGWDCTLSAPKALSILWMSGTAEQRRRIEAILAAAVDAALKFLTDEGLVSVRLGAGGHRREAPTDILVGRFAHYTTRDGDPQLHTHCVILNTALSADGRYRTLEPDRLFVWQLVVGSAFRTALAERLVGDLGLRLRPAGQGQFEIAGIPQDMIDHLSKRSAAVVDRIGGDRAGISAARKEVAALATRGAKADVPTGPALEARWRADLAGFGVDPWEAAREAAQHPDAPLEIERDRGLDIDPPELEGTSPVRLAATTLLRHETVIDRRAVLENGLDAAALQGIGIAGVRSELATLEGEGHLLRLTPAGRDTRWTTPSLAKVEAALLRAADRPATPSRFRPEALSAALAAAPNLSAEQRAAVEHAAAPGGVAVVEAGAGTGKTTTARAIVDAAMRSGLTVVGLAPSWVAADELSASTGIPAYAVAKWRHDQAQNAAAPLDADTLVILDEAGMVGTRDM
jgi:conjugative relaxase-like TrwC/TraI family protein